MFVRLIPGLRRSRFPPGFNTVPQGHYCKHTHTQLTCVWLWGSWTGGWELPPFRWTRPQTHLVLAEPNWPRPPCCCYRGNCLSRRQSGCNGSWSNSSGLWTLRHTQMMKCHQRTEIKSTSTVSNVESPTVCFVIQFQITWKRRQNCSNSVLTAQTLEVSMASGSPLRTLLEVTLLTAHLQKKENLISEHSLGSFPGRESWIESQKVTDY